MREESNGKVATSRTTYSMSKRARRLGRVIGDMKIQPHGSSLQQNPAIASSDVASSKKKNRVGIERPGAEVVRLSPRTLLATNRFVCMVCNKGFQRDQNLQLHLRGHNLPWKLKQKNPKEARRRVYVCPELTCVHNKSSRALGDLTGIKKHYCRKHGEKNLKCDKCNKRYAVESDRKAHRKTCGTREYRCNCNTLFTRRDSYIAHRATCDVALAADREAIQMPPPAAAAAAGAGLYVGSGSDGLRLSGAATNMLGFADQGQSSSAAEASLFDHIMPYPGSSMFPSQASGFSLSFLLGGGAPATNQYLLFEHAGDHSEGIQGPLPHGKAPLYDLMHLPEQQYQTSSSNNYLGFFSGNSGGESGSQGPLPHGNEPFHGPEQQPSSSNAYLEFLSGNSGGSQGPLPHGKEPFHGHDLIMQLPEQQQHHQPSTSNAYLEFLSVNGGGASSSQGPLLHGNEPFHGHDLMQLPEQQNCHQPGSSNANVNNIPNLGLFSGNNSGSWSCSSQDASLVIQDQFNGGAGGSNTEHVNVMASTGSHFGGGFPSLQHNPSPSPSPSAGLSATALLMKAAQMGSTSSSTGDGPSALLRAAGFTGTISGGEGTSRAAEEGVMSHEAHFDDLVMNTRDFLGVGRDEAMAPAAGVNDMGALDPNQMKWFM